MKNIMIIGAGIAAINAIKAIREVDQAVGIDLFGEERFYPYNRMKLSKSLLDKLDEDSILLQKKDWYELNKVNLHLNVGVQGVDVAKQEIILLHEKRIGYDKLLLATGAGNRPPFIEGAGNGMDTIRKLDDVRRLYGEMEGKEIVLNIGGGIQGLETAWVLQQHQKKVIIAEIQARLFPNQLDERAAAILKDRVEAAGIKVFTHAEAVKLIGRGKEVIGVEMRDGSQVPCDMVLYSTGIEPNIGLVKGTPVRTDQGVLVDEKMQTNIENVFAAGDVAQFGGKVYGLWNIAVGQGKTAGYNMANQAAVYEPVVPVTTLNGFGVSLFSMGNVSENTSAGDSAPTFVDEDRVRNTYRRIFIKDNIITGAIVIGDTSKSPLLKNAIEQKLPLDNIDWNNTTMDEFMDLLKKLKK